MRHYLKLSHKIQVLLPVRMYVLPSPSSFLSGYKQQRLHCKKGEIENDCHGFEKMSFYCKQYTATNLFKVILDELY